MLTAHELGTPGCCDSLHFPIFYQHLSYMGPSSSSRDLASHLHSTWCHYAWQITLGISTPVCKNAGKYTECYRQEEAKQTSHGFCIFAHRVTNSVWCDFHLIFLLDQTSLLFDLKYTRTHTFTHQRHTLTHTHILREREGEIEVEISNQIFS